MKKIKKMSKLFVDRSSWKDFFMQEEKKEIGVVPAEVLTNEQMKQQNINAIREMEKMSKEEKKKLLLELLSEL